MATGIEILSRPPLSLQPVRERLRRCLDTADGELREAAGHLLLCEGKLLRPTLVLLAAQAVGHGDHATDESVIDYAAAAEMIHVASLIHDDVIDEANTRRGAPSVNSRFGNHTAVLVGDFLFASAFEILSKYAARGVLTLMTGAIARMCQGEVQQKRDAYSPDVTEEAYMKRIEAKTASLLAACCEGGALLAGAGEEVSARFRMYGTKLGLAFQIADDLLDFEGDARTMGKPAGADLLRGIVTLPLIRVLAQPVWRVQLAPALSRRAVDGEIVALARHAARLSGAIASTYETAKELADAAHKEVRAFAQSAAGAVLHALCLQAVARSY